MQAAYPAQTACRDEPAMLQVALAPTTFPYRPMDDRRPYLFIRLLDLRHQAQAPASAEQQRGLHEIVAEQVSTKGWSSGQVREAGVAAKGANANNGIVAPVAARSAVPECGSRSHRGAPPIVNAIGKLLVPTEQAVAIDQDRWRLDERNIGIALEGGCKPDQGLPAHQAVGVEHDHIVIGGSPAPTPFGDVASLLVGSDGPPAII